MRCVPLLITGLLAAALSVGTARDPDFWRTPDQRGDALLRQARFADAAKAYADPERVGLARYRNGDFEAAAHAFARVPGAPGAYDQGNAWLMHGKYDDAVASYDRALALHPNWVEAEENKSVALARKAKLDASGENRDQEQANAYKPDEIAFDQRGDDRKGKPVELSQESLSDEELRASWLRQVRTSPADFLRAKFAYQASAKGGKP